MQTVLYDGSWPGLLTAIFEVYEYKFKDVQLSVNSDSGSLFAEAHQVHTSTEKAARVLKTLQGILTMKRYHILFRAFLSEEKGIENIILGFVQYIIATGKTAENDFSNRFVLHLHNTTKKVDREKHRMEAFVRFQCTKDELYYATIQPDFNVLPLIVKHFKNRYADQKWLIYDTRRKYGMYYDLEKVEEITMSFSEEANNATLKTTIFDTDETLYQTLWQQYFSSVNIAARKNTKLHIQHMPKRYWKYLIEKQVY